MGGPSADNFYRQLEAKLDLSFVRELVRDCYEGLLGAESYVGEMF